VHAGHPGAGAATVAAYAIVGERQQGTLELVLTTPVRREEFLLAKALDALIPAWHRLCRLRHLIHAALAFALTLADALLILDGLGWRITSATFDRERLITCTR
jgi:hypothetical protein